MENMNVIAKCLVHVQKTWKPRYVFICPCGEISRGEIE